MEVYVRNVGNGYQVVGLQHARILSGSWRNFSKEARMYDTGNVRHFAILVEEENFKKLSDLGFNVGIYTPREGDPYHYLDINFGWQLRDPEIYIVNGNVTTKQTEETVGTLDKCNNIEYADIEVSPHHWNNNGRSGVKPWVSEMYIYMVEPSPIHQSWQERVAAYNSTDDCDDIPF